MDWQLFFGWIDKVASILGVTLMVFAVVGGIRSFYIWITQPKLRLRFDKARTFDEQMVPMRDEELPTKWVHVTVTGHQRQRINNARAYLTNVWRVDENGELERIPNFKTKLPLAWANSGGRFELDILPKELTRIDVFYYIMERPMEIRVHTNINMAGTVTAFKAGEYVLSIMATADNAKADSIVLRVKASDDPETYGVNVTQESKCA